MSMLKRLLARRLTDGSSVRFAVKSGSVTPAQDAQTLEIPETIDDAFAVYVMADFDEAAAKGENSVFAVTGLVNIEGFPYSAHYADGGTLLSARVYNTDGVGASRVPAVPTENGFSMTAGSTHRFRKGLQYKYKIYVSESSGRAGEEGETP